MRAGAKAVAPILVGIVPLGLVSEGGYRDDIAIVPCYVAAWATLASVWQVTNVLGAVAGTIVRASWQLDFVIPLVFLGMLVLTPPPSRRSWCRERSTCKWTAPTPLLPSARSPRP